MNDRELEKHLQRLETPKPLEEARKRALAASLEALKTARGPASDRPAPIVYPWKLTGIAAACLALLAGFLLFTFRPGSSPGERVEQPEATEDPYASERRVFNEIEELFAGRLAAIVLENGESRLMLDDQRSELAGGRGKPVVMRFSSGTKNLRWISFSGQNIELELDGRRYRFELLVSGRDEVILVADDFIWTPSQPFPVEGVEASAARLTTS